jgi:predicted dehydrogenase
VTQGVALIGCGVVGGKRANALAGARLVICADPDRAKAERLAAAAPGAEATADWRQAVASPRASIVVVATTNDALAEITLEALKAGKHVLVEKPAARRAAELRPVLEAARAARVQVRVGFNHRYHPALLQALEMSRKGEIGELMFLRGRYGHGGRLGYDREWRADPAKAGGGELIDQGVHLIDLARCFLGEFEEVSGFAHTYFWDMPVDDNGFMLLRTRESRAAFLHVSCTEWKNLFSLEVYGRTGKLQVDGLGGSYGVERLTHYRMLARMGPPETAAWDYPAPDRSWELEFKEFLEDIRLGRAPSAGLEDAMRALEVVEKIYQSSRA